MFHLIVGAAIVFFVGREAIRAYRARLYKKRLAIWAEETLNPDIDKLTLQERFMHGTQTIRAGGNGILPRRS